MAADETATTSLVFDASAALKGAQDFVRAGGQIIQTLNAVQAAVDKAAKATGEAEVKKANARAEGTKKAKDAAALEAAIAAAGADAMAQRADRIVKSLSTQSAALDRYARMWDPFVAGADRAARQLENVFDISEKTRGAVQQRAQAMLPQAAALAAQATLNQAAGFDINRVLGQFQTKFEPDTESARRMGAEQQQINRLFEVGAINAQTYAGWNAKLAASYDTAGQAAQRQKEALAELINTTRAQAEATQKAFETQHMYNVGAAPGIQNQLGTVGGRPVFDQDANSARASAAVFDEQFQAEEKLRQERAALIAQFDPLTVAAERYAKALGTIQRAVDLNVISDTKANELRAAETKSYGAGATSIDAATKYLGNFRNEAFGARFAAQQLGVQTIQFFSSIQAGQPFLQAFIGQAHQVADVAIATGTGFSVLTAAVRGWIAALTRLVVANPIIAGAAAAAAAIVGLGAVAEVTNRRLQASRNVLSVQRPDDFVKATDDAEVASKRLAGSTDLSTKSARQAMQALYSDPAFKGTRDQAVQIGASFERVSKALGEASPNFQHLADMLRNPAQFMKQMTEQMQALDPWIARQVEHLQNMGDRAGATSLALKAMDDATRNVALTPFAQSLVRLANALHPVTEAVRGLATVIGTVFTSLATGLINTIAVIIETIEKIPALIGRVGSAIGSGISSLLPDRHIEANPAPWNRTRGVQPSQTSPTAQTAAFANTTQAIDKAALEAVGHLSLLSERIKTLTEDQTALTKAFEAAAKIGNVEKMQLYGDALKVVQGELYQTVGPQEQMIRQLDQQAHLAQSLTEGDQKLASALQQLNELNRQHPETARQGQDLEVMNKVIEEQTGEYNKLKFAIGQQTTEQTKLTAAYGDGYANVEKATAANMALMEAMKLFPQNWKQQTDAIRELTETYEKLIIETQRAQAAQRGLENRDTIEFLRQQTAAVGQSALERERNLNHIKTEQELLRQFPSPEQAGVREGLLKQGDEIFSRQQALEQVNSLNLVSDAARRLKEARDILTSERDSAQTRGDTEAVERLNLALKANQGQVYETIGPQAQMARQMQLQAQLAQVLTEGDQKLLGVRQQLDELDKQHPDTASQEARQKALNAAVQEQIGQFNRLVFERQQQIQAQNALTAAYGQSYGAVAHVTAANQALIESMRLFARGSQEQIQAAKELTKIYEALAASAQRVQAAEMAAQNRDTIELLNAEVTSLGQDSLARERYLNSVRTELELKRQLPLLSDQARTALLRENEAIFAQQQALQVHQQAMNELEGVASQAFETLGKSLTEPLKEGETAAQRLRQTITSVVDDLIKEFLKLAVINPLMNELFPSGQHRPTLGDAFTTPKPLESTTDQTIKAITGGGLPIDPLTGAMRVIDVGAGSLLGGAGGGTAAADNGGVLAQIRKYESGGGTDTAGSNVYNYLHDTDPKYSASGFYQMTDTTWREGARMAGVDSSQYPTAISAPYETQTSVAQAVLDRYGLQPWQGNSKLMAAMGKGGAANDNAAGGGIAALTGGLPLDPITGAVRVTLVGGVGSLGAPTTGDTAANQVAKAAEGDTSTSGGGAASSETTAAQAASAAVSATAGVTKNFGTSETSDSGGLFSWLGKHLFGEGSSGGSSSSRGSSSSGGATPDSSSDDGLFGHVGKLLHDFPGGLLDSAFGKGFYRGGGLIGQWMNGIDPATGVGNLASGFDYSGMAAGAGLDALSQDAAGIAASGIGGTASILHSGGLVGVDRLQHHAAPVDPRIFLGAPRLHTGLNSDEFAAILQHGERVLTANQNSQLESLVPSLADMNRGGGAANENQGPVTNNNGHTINVHVGGPMSSDDARRTGYQVANAVAGHLRTASARGAAR